MGTTLEAEQNADVEDDAPGVFEVEPDRELAGVGGRGAWPGGRSDESE
jgi:hypothetical protein